MDLENALEGLLHAETQLHDGGADLSVAEVYAVDEPGRVDFGGGELAPAALAPVETELRAEGDEYGWWNLEAGQYLVEYNESLAGGEFRLEPRRELLERGGSHPSLAVTDLPRVPLSVGGAGLRLKENARVSTLRPR
ncbi:MAG: dCTP deaminase [Halobacteriaceae archaeon]